MSFNKIISLLDRPKPYKNSNSKITEGYRAVCPSCLGSSDTKLNVSLTLENKILIHCFGGCSIDSICDSLGVRVEDLFPDGFNKLSEPSYINKVKGWDWWSIASALEILNSKLLTLHFKLIEITPNDSASRLYVADLIGEIKDLAESLKYGKKLK